MLRAAQHALAALALALAAPAWAEGAPEPNAAPAYGELRVPGGSGPYPHVMEITPGGPIDAASLGESCAGFIARAPDVRVRYRGDGRLALAFAVRGDGTLVVNDPSGAWRCGGDALAIAQPEAGQYDIWIGAREAGLGPRVRLEISETAPAR